MAMNAVFDLDNDSDDDEGIVLLDGPPEHLKTVSIASSPIVIDSSDEEDDSYDAIGSVRMALKRPRSINDYASDHLIHKQPKVNNAVAGSSRQPKPAAIFVDDSDDEGTPPQDAPPPQHILPKADYLVPIVQEIIPDIDPQWAKENIERVMNELKDSSNAPGQDAVDQVINMALETGEYLKIGGPVAAPPEEPDYGDPNYNRGQRTGPGYMSLSMEMLLTVFPTIPVGHLRVSFEEAGHQLVPAYQLLHRQSTAADKPYTELKRGRSCKGKGRAEEDIEDERDVEAALADVGGALEAKRERMCLRGIMAKAMEKEKEDLAVAAAKEKAEADHVERKAAAEALGDGVECQCCFDTEAPLDTAACPDGHFFCHGCIRQHAETKLGDQIAVIRCMDGSGCEELFTDATLATILSEKTMSLYHRLKQMKELELAGIPGLESCPYCPFAMVIETQNEKLFRCLNPTCLKVTCRQCRRPDHIPKRCDEVEADLKLDKRHAVEEAMSEALMRKCPKCAKPYVKESGCNKIMCQGCGTMSCYICQQAIHGYNHFDQQPGGHMQALAPAPASTSATPRCRLWDAKEIDLEAQRIVQARDAAAQRMLVDAANLGVELTADDLRVDAPEVARPQLRRVPLPAPRMERGAGPGGYLQERLRQMGDIGLDPARVGAALEDNPFMRQIAHLNERIEEEERRHVADRAAAAPQGQAQNLAAALPLGVVDLRRHRDILQRAERQIEEVRQHEGQAAARNLAAMFAAPPALRLPGLGFGFGGQLGHPGFFGRVQAVGQPPVPVPPRRPRGRRGAPADPPAPPANANANAPEPEGRAPRRGAAAAVPEPPAPGGGRRRARRRRGGRLAEEDEAIADVDRPRGGDRRVQLDDMPYYERPRRALLLEDLVARRPDDMPGGLPPRPLLVRQGAPAPGEGGAPGPDPAAPEAGGRGRRRIVAPFREAREALPPAQQERLEQLRQVAAANRDVPAAPYPTAVRVPRGGAARRGAWRPARPAPPAHDILDDSDLDDYDLDNPDYDLDWEPWQL